MKKKLALLLALLLTLAAIWACTPQQPASTGSAAPSTKAPAASAGGTAAPKPSLQPEESTYSEFVTAPEVFPVVKEPFTMRVFAIQPATIEDFTTNALTIAYEERTGVHLEWEIAPSNAGTEKRNISLVSGDYPDIYLGAGITKEDEMIYGPQGVFIALNDLIEVYGPNIVKSFEELPIVKSMGTAPDGSLYSLPNMSNAIHTLTPNKLWMNTTWLNTLGLEAPTTTEEFYQTLKAFRDNDPNRNGQPDEIPFFAPDNKGSQFVTFFMNSFICSDQDLLHVNSEGKIDASFTKPEWREGLEYIKMLVEEGLIDETSFAATNDQLKQIAENPGDMILGATVSLSPSSFMDLNGEKQKNYDTVAPLLGPNGVRYAMYRPGAYCTTGCFVVTKAMEHPEVAIRWVDYFYTWEGALEARIGREGSEWRRAEPGELSYAGLPALWGKLTGIGGAQNFFWSQWGMGQFNRHDRQTTDPDIYAPTGLEGRLFKASNENYMPYIPENFIPPLYISRDTMKKINQPLTDVRSYVQESIVRFATGDLSLANDWDTYVKNLEAMGLSDVIAAYQEAYDAYVANAGK